jgi:hypothetical protein
MQRIRSHLSFANAISMIALFVALGGTSYALAKNSIGARERSRRTPSELPRSRRTPFVRLR